MINLIVITSLFGIILFALAVGGRLSKKVFSNSYKASPLLTGKEHEFYGRLVRASPPDHVILPHVPMGAIIKPDCSDISSTWKAFFAIPSKRIVFVVWNFKTNKVALIVELDDKAGSPSKDAERDRITLSAGYKTVRFNSSEKPTQTDIQHVFNLAIIPEEDDVPLSTCREV